MRQELVARAWKITARIRTELNEVHEALRALAGGCIGEEEDLYLDSIEDNARNLQDLAQRLGTIRFLLEACLMEFDGTPEEFGALLQTATCPPWGVDSEAMMDAMFEQQRAIAQIEKLTHGAELLKQPEV